MTAVLALVSALVIGGSDFGGGLATRHDNTFRVTAIAQIFGGITAVLLAVAVGSDEVVAGDVIGGLVAGVSGTFSFICFYRALSIGVMSVVAPTTAVVGAAIPAIIGIGRGEELSLPTALGIGVAILAIVLVARTGTVGAGPGDRSSRSALILAITAGIGFSAFFIALAETESAAGMWPLVVARIVSVPVVCGIAWTVAGGIWPVDPRSRRLAVATGVSEMIANAILVVALRRGPVAVAAVFGSLYPVSTVLLAWVVLRERISRLQMAGVGLAIGALVLVAA
jgi:drug/metabolite transporter (DMT)-like permease